MLKRCPYTLVPQPPSETLTPIIWTNCLGRVISFVGLEILRPDFLQPITGRNRTAPILLAQWVSTLT